MTTGTRTAGALAALACLVGLLALPRSAGAGGSATSIYGGRRMGMLANIGRPDDPTALFHNPAGLADQKGFKLYGFISPAFLSTDFRMKELDAKRFPSINPPGCGAADDPCPWPVDSNGYYDANIEPEKYFGVIPYLGVSTDLDFLGPRGRDVVVSAAIYSANFYGAYLPEAAPTSFYAIGGLFLVGSATVGIGWRLNKFISVGANFSYNYMHLLMSRRMSLAHSLTPKGQPVGGLASLAQSLVGDIRFDYEGVNHGVGWNASVLVTPLPWLNIGLGYSGATPPKFEGPLEFSTYNDKVPDEEALTSLVHQVGYKLPGKLEVELALPHSLQFGVNVQIGRQVELGVDLRLWFYNMFSRQVVRPIYDAAEEGKEPLSEDTMSQDKDYMLSYQVSGGVLVRPFKSFLQLELMVGGGYDQSPIPDHTFTIDNPNLSHAKVAAGVRWRINDHWLVSVGYLLNLYVSRDVRDSETNPPTNVQVASHSHSPALEATYTF